MKIKHFAGYGSVNAKKVSREEFEDYMCEKKIRLVIRVWGMHELGLERGTWDTYGIFNWLVKRFDKKCLSERQIESISTDDRYEKDPKTGLDIEVCDYTIEYRESSSWEK